MYTISRRILGLIGELYDLEADPHEALLYGEPAFQEIVEQCEKLLCHWLISTRQYRTAFLEWNETNYDPHEALNLYGEPAFQEIVEQCEKLLCHWLISTRQYRTAFLVGEWMLV